MSVSNVMSPDVKVCRPEDSLNDAARLMWENDFGCVPVVNSEGHVVGVVTDRDICMCAYIQGGSLASIPVSAAMSHGVHFCKATDSLTTAAGLMRNQQVRRLPVVDEDERIIGIVSINDLVRETEREKSSARRRDLSPEYFTQVMAIICEPRSLHAASGVETSSRS
jgi:CBS domain-containing protein